MLVAASNGAPEHDHGGVNEEEDSAVAMEALAFLRARAGGDADQQRLQQRHQQSPLYGSHSGFSNGDSGAFRIQQPCRSVAALVQHAMGPPFLLGMEMLGLAAAAAATSKGDNNNRSQQHQHTIAAKKGFSATHSSLSSSTFLSLFRDYRLFLFRNVLPDCSDRLYVSGLCAAHAKVNQSAAYHAQRDEAAVKDFCTFHPSITEHGTNSRQKRTQMVEFYDAGLTWQQKMKKKMGTKIDRANADKAEQDEIDFKPWAMDPRSVRIANEAPAAAAASPRKEMAEKKNETEEGGGGGGDGDDDDSEGNTAGESASAAAALRRLAHEIPFASPRFVVTSPEKLEQLTSPKSAFSSAAILNHQQHYDPQSYFQPKKHHPHTCAHSTALLQQGWNRSHAGDPDACTDVLTRMTIDVENRHRRQRQMQQQNLINPSSFSMHIFLPPDDEEVHDHNSRGTTTPRRRQQQPQKTSGTDDDGDDEYNENESQRRGSSLTPRRRGVNRVVEQAAYASQLSASGVSTSNRVRHCRDERQALEASAGRQATETDAHRRVMADLRTREAHLRVALETLQQQEQQHEPSEQLQKKDTTARAAAAAAAAAEDLCSYTQRRQSQYPNAKPITARSATDVCAAAPALSNTYFGSPLEKSVLNTVRDRRCVQYHHQQQQRGGEQETPPHTPRRGTHHKQNTGNTYEGKSVGASSCEALLLDSLPPADRFGWRRADTKARTNTPPNTVMTEPPHAASTTPPHSFISSSSPHAQFEHHLRSATKRNIKSIPPITSTTTTTTTMPTNVPAMVARFAHYAERRSERCAAQKQQQEQALLEPCSFTPRVNKKSERMVQQAFYQNSNQHNGNLDVAAAPAIRATNAPAASSSSSLSRPRRTTTTTTTNSTRPRLRTDSPAYSSACTTLRGRVSATTPTRQPAPATTANTSSRDGHHEHFSGQKKKSVVVPPAAATIVAAPSSSPLPPRLRQTVSPSSIYPADESGENDFYFNKHNNNDNNGPTSHHHHHQNHHATPNACSTSSSSQDVLAAELRGWFEAIRLASSYHWIGSPQRQRTQRRGRHGEGEEAVGSTFADVDVVVPIDDVLREFAHILPPGFDAAECDFGTSGHGGGWAGDRGFTFDQFVQFFFSCISLSAK